MPSIKDVGHLEGEEGSKLSQNLTTDRSGKIATRGRGVSKNRKKLPTSHLLWTVFERSFIYYANTFMGNGDQTLLIFTTKGQLISKCSFGVIV